MSETPPYGTGDASYQAAGGIDGLRHLVDDFYRLMDERPEAAALRALRARIGTVHQSAPIPPRQRNLVITSGN